MKNKIDKELYIKFYFSIEKNLTYSKVKLGSPEGTKFDSVCLAISGGNQDAMVENITLQLEVRFLTFLSDNLVVKNAAFPTFSILSGSKEFREFDIFVFMRSLIII